MGFAILALFTVLAGDAWRYTVSWWGYGVIAIAIATVSVLILIRERDRWRFPGLPLPLVSFVAYAVLSTAWSFYPGSTALASLTTLMTVTLGVALGVAYTWAKLLKALGWALRIILGLSLLFEFVVGAFIRQPVLPLWVDYPDGSLPKLLYWSRNLLFEGGKIQGIVGNSSLLAMIALLAVIVFGIQLATRAVNKYWGWLWLVTAAIVIGMTRSPTIYAALAAIAFVLLVVLLLRTARTPRQRTAIYAAALLFVAAGVAVVLTFGRQLLEVVGKSPDLTGRLGIWETVIGLAQERPWFGWGWVSYWTPWVEPFDDLVVRAGVVQLHAHNAWLDVWMQLGIVGLVLFGTLVLTALVKAWQHAVDRPQELPDAPQPYTAITLLPLLIMVALIVQSLAESRLLIEYGLVLLTVVAVKTKRRELT